LGSQTAEHPTAIMGQICTGIHVCYVFVYITLATSLEEIISFEVDLDYISETVDLDSHLLIYNNTI